MNIDFLQVIYGLLLSTLIGGLAYWRHSLTASGWLGAVVTGTATFGFGGWSWGLLLVTFFVTSSLLSRYKQSVKSERAGEKFEKGGRRDFWQAMANGGIAALLALLYALFTQPSALYFAYIGVLATVTADTWATELGTLSKHSPILITTWRPTETGTSGAVTTFGTVAAALGGLMIGCAALLFALGEQFAGRSAQLFWFLPIVGLVSGLAGALCDSFMGATVQAMYLNGHRVVTEKRISGDGVPHRHIRGWQWMNNDAVNLLSSLAGGLVALVLGIVLT